jgi:hypothetical protein
MMFSAMIRIGMQSIWGKERLTTMMMMMTISKKHLDKDSSGHGLP